MKTNVKFAKQSDSERRHGFAPGSRVYVDGACVGLIARSVVGGGWGWWSTDDKQTSGGGRTRAAAVAGLLFHEQARHPLAAEGQLKHYFHGEYRAAIVLCFKSPALAAAALPVLGSGWAPGAKHAHVLVWGGDSAALKQAKALLGSLGADVDKIDSCAKSIDHGEPFICRFPMLASVA
jgi:hypothetical protein